MKNKNHKRRLRAIKRTDLRYSVIGDSLTVSDISPFDFPSPLPKALGLFPFQHYYRGRRVFALFDGDKYLNAFDDLSKAKLMLCELRKDFIGRFTIVKMEAI